MDVSVGTKKKSNGRHPNKHILCQFQVNGGVFKMLVKNCFGFGCVQYQWEITDFPLQLIFSFCSAGYTNRMLSFSRFSNRNCLSFPCFFFLWMSFGTFTRFHQTHASHCVCFASSSFTLHLGNQKLTLSTQIQINRYNISFSSFVLIVSNTLRKLLWNRHQRQWNSKDSFPFMHLCGSVWLCGSHSM